MSLGARRLREVQALAQATLALVLERSGRLVGLSVRAPVEMDVRELRQALSEELSAVGIEFIDLDVRPGLGPLRIVAAEFEATV